MSSYPVLDVLKVLRFPNLLVVAATQLLVYYKVLVPAFRAENIIGVLTTWKLFELVAVTLLITASGYLINDIQDAKTDQINRPGTNPVSRLGQDTVTWFYAGAVLAGFLVSQLLAYRLDERHLLWIFPLAVGALAIYSVSLKRLPALGNFVVALYCAGVPGIILLAERSAVAQLVASNHELGSNALRITLLFMLFAFLATLLRELVKDLEDLRGDREVGRRTIPVMLGSGWSRRLGLALGLLVIVAILAPVLLGWAAFLERPLLLCIGVLILAIFYIVVRLQRAREPREYHALSTQLKLVLLGGLGLLLFF